MPDNREKLMLDTLVLVHAGLVAFLGSSSFFRLIGLRCWYARYRRCGDKAVA